ncbi:MAG: AgmX/PglI C-terminal domain-containing protein [Myxococcota bacterium]
MLWIALILANADAPRCDRPLDTRAVQLSDRSTTSSCVDANGVPQGPMWNVAADGRLRWVEDYRDGTPEGLWMRFSREGEPLERRQYRAGQLDGPWEQWFPDGRKRLVGALVRGKKNGPFESWHRGGERAFSASFAEGRPDGEWQLFNRKGKAVARCGYAKGSLTLNRVLALERPLERVHVVERLSEVKSPARFCYERELAVRPELARGGAVEFSFLVTPVGLTAEVRLTNSTLHDPAVERCIGDVLQQLSFPQLVTCELVEVAFPFEFSAR